MKTGKQKKNEPAIKFERSCGNVFADLGLPDAEELLAKSTIISDIHAAINNHRITGVAAAKLIGIQVHDLAQMLGGDLDRYTKKELQRFRRTLRACFNGKAQP